MISNSQAMQDVFVLSVLKKKSNGFYIEIGANCPLSRGSNSLILEKTYGWKGLMVEYDTVFKQSYINNRPNSYYIINDARKINYREFFDEKNFPLNIDYLQIDLDVDNRSTLDVLELFDETIFGDYKFATITFEHDIYTGNHFNTRTLSREIFLKHGYILVFPDVQTDDVNPRRFVPFEDWYIHPDLVDIEYINKIKTDISLNYLEIEKILNECWKAT